MYQLCQQPEYDQTVSLRRATADDIPDMANLWAALVREENPKARPDVKMWCGLQEHLINNDNYHCYVVEIAGQIVGFNNGLLLTDMETGETYLEGGHFYVLPDHRKSMAGFKLHRNGMDVARATGAKFLRRKVSAGNKRMMDRLNRGIGTIKEYVVDEGVTR